MDRNRTDLSTNACSMQLFREAMASYPSGVTIVTTTATDGRWWGFTATAFSSLSVDPPLVLVCLAKTAECHPVFETSQSWIVHVVDEQYANLALRFATRGADKFDGAGFSADEDGLPELPDASVLLKCIRYASYPGGDHSILVGRVYAVVLNPAPPAVYFHRAFHALRSLEQ